MTDFTETRSMLKKLAMSGGADTPIGHACHNILEMTENYSKQEDQKVKGALLFNIQQQMEHLAALRRGE